MYETLEFIGGPKDGEKTELVIGAIEVLIPIFERPPYPFDDADLDDRPEIQIGIYYLAERIDGVRFLKWGGIL